MYKLFKPILWYRRIHSLIYTFSPTDNLILDGTPGSVETYTFGLSSADAVIVISVPAFTTKYSVCWLVPGGNSKPKSLAVNLNVCALVPENINSKAVLRAFRLRFFSVCLSQ